MPREEEFEGFQIGEEVLVARRAEYNGEFFENPKVGSVVRIKYFQSGGYASVAVASKKHFSEYLISVKCLEHLAPSDAEVQQAIESILHKSPKEDT